MKRMTLDMTWDLCLKMWKWISEHYKEFRNVNAAKAVWLQKRGYEDQSIDSNCFFCEYDERAQSSLATGDTCHFCPGRKVDSEFHCHRSIYNYYTRPVEFYAELKRLNKIRKPK